MAILQNIFVPDNIKAPGLYVVESYRQKHGSQYLRRMTQCCR